MKRIVAACCAVALAGCAVPGAGMMGGMMNPAGMAMNGAALQQQMAGASLQASMASAQATANRPGDEQLTCDQLQAEMMTMFNDPAFRNTVAALGAKAQEQQKQTQSFIATTTTTSVATGALGLAGAVIPGMSWLSQGAAMAAQAQMMAAAVPAVANQTAVMGDISSMMPQMMRGQRINDLGIKKKCAFVTGVAR